MTHKPPLSRAGMALGAIPADSLGGWTPTQAQMLAKARLHARLRDLSILTDIGSLAPARLAELAGDRRLSRWLDNPDFVAWVYDRDDFAHRAIALKDEAIQVLADILRAEYEPKVLTAKDKLKAADMLLQLTGAYPSKTKEIRYLDKDLAELTEAEATKQLADVQAELAALDAEAGS